MDLLDSEELARFRHQHPETGVEHSHRDGDLEHFHKPAKEMTVNEFFAPRPEFTPALEPEQDIFGAPDLITLMQQATAAMDQLAQAVRQAGEAVRIICEMADKVIERMGSAESGN